jgi:hypothetical protein
MSETEVLKPYSGPPATPDTFAQAFPQLETAIKKGVNNLDPESQASLNELMAQMRSNPPLPATVVNLHPWPLAFNYGSRILRGITIPACPPGQQFAHGFIRVWRKDWKYNENGNLVFSAISPIQIAAEFVREFSNKDNDGGGVIIYQGEKNPGKVEQVELYDVLGRALTDQVQGYEYDEENNKQPVMMFKSKFGSFADLLKSAILVRNEIYFRKVQAADHDYKLPDNKGKRNITDKHRMMAEVLYAEGMITKLPEWDLASRLDEGLSDSNCKACGRPVSVGGYKCTNCNNIIDVVAAFRDGADIPTAKFDLLTIDEAEEIEEIKAERAEAREAAKKLAATTPRQTKAQKAAAKSQQQS